MNKITRYGWNAAGRYLNSMPDGEWVRFTDHEQALAAERARVRAEEVKPLMDFAIYMRDQENMTFAECSVAEDLWRRCRDAIVVVERIQKELP